MSVDIPDSGTLLGFVPTAQYGDEIEAERCAGWSRECTAGSPWRRAAHLRGAAGTQCGHRHTGAHRCARRRRGLAPTARHAARQISNCGARGWTGVLESQHEARLRALYALTHERTAQPTSDQHMLAKHHHGGHGHLRHRHLPRIDRHGRLHAAQSPHRRVESTHPVPWCHTSRRTADGTHCVLAHQRCRQPRHQRGADQIHGVPADPCGVVRLRLHWP